MPHGKMLPGNIKTAEHFQLRGNLDDHPLITYRNAMSTVELIYEKAKSLPGGLQSEALSFVEYLSRRLAAKTEASEWQRLFCETQRLHSAQSISDDDIAAEIAASRLPSDR